MLLAIDAGNTNVVFAVHDGAEWRGRWRIATRPDRTSDEYAVWLLALLQHCGLKPPRSTAASSAPWSRPRSYNLRRLSREWFHVDPAIRRRIMAELSRMLLRCPALPAALRASPPVMNVAG